MATVTVLFNRNNSRSEALAAAAYAGVRAVGEKARLLDVRLYSGVTTDYAVFYGFSGGLQQVFEDYKAQATAVYIDLGYWQRRMHSRYDGYHKVVVNSRHPTAYFQQRAHEHSRFEQFGIKIQPWRKRRHGYILVAGMSEKASRVAGVPHQAWERDAIRQLRAVTDREIVYRPKPNCLRSPAISGVRYNKRTPLESVLDPCHAVVARHSNVTLDGLIHGVPAFCVDGVARPLAEPDLARIETPLFPNVRHQLCADVAWCQFTTAEIGMGLPFRHLKDEGLLP